MKRVRVIVIGAGAALVACNALLGIDGEILEPADGADTGAAETSSNDVTQGDAGELFAIVTKRAAVIQGTTGKVVLEVRDLPDAATTVTLSDLPAGVTAPVFVPPSTGEHTIVLTADAFAQIGAKRPSITLRAAGREQTSSFDLDVTGPMDRAFGDAGIAPLGFSLRLEAPVPLEELGSVRRDNVGLDVLDGGAALVAFSTSDGVSGPVAHAVVARVRPNGAIDTSFADAGRLAFAPNTRAFDMITLANGAHLVAGLDRSSGAPSALVALVDPTTGALLGSDTIDVGPSVSEGLVSVVPMGPTGAVGLSSTGSGDYSLVRTATPPTIDDTRAMGLNLRAHTLVRESDSKVFVVGIAQGAQSGRITRRFVADAGFDPTFTATSIAGRPNDLRAGTVVDGGVVVVGSSASGGGVNVNAVQIARVHPNGSLDVGFGNVGGVSVEGVAGASVIHALVIQPTGSFLVGGSARAGGVANVVFARFSSNGILDKTFGAEGFMLVPFARDAQVRRLALQGNAVIAAIVTDPKLASEGQDVLLVRILP